MRPVSIKTKISHELLYMKNQLSNAIISETLITQLNFNYEAQKLYIQSKNSIK